MCLEPHKWDSIGARKHEVNNVGGVEIMFLRDDGQMFRKFIPLGIIDSTQVVNSINLMDDMKKIKKEKK